MTRDGSGAFQVESYQPLPSGTDPVAAGVRPGAGLYFGKGQTIFPYDYATNTIGTAIVIPGVDTAISGMHFTADGKDLLVASHLNVLYRVSTATWTVVPGWSFDLTPYGFVDPRGVALVGDQLFIVDGGLRPVGDPLRYAMFVFDIVDASGAPTANFTASPTTGTAPVATTFIDRSTGVPTSWIWNFGDGSTSTVARPTHIYTTAGSYSVTLTVTNALGTATTTQPNLVTVAVNPPLLNAKFSGTPTSGASPLPVQFTDASVGGVTGWAWDFGDGSTSTEQNPQHTYLTNGSFTVKLTVTTPTGTNQRIRTDYVNVSALPTTVTAAADSYVRSDSAGTNFGIGDLGAGLAYYGSECFDLPAVRSLHGPDAAGDANRGHVAPLRDRRQRDQRDAVPHCRHVDRIHDQLQQPTGDVGELDRRQPQRATGSVGRVRRDLHRSPRPASTASH